MRRRSLDVFGRQELLMDQVFWVKVRDPDQVVAGKETDGSSLERNQAVDFQPMEHPVYVDAREPEKVGKVFLRQRQRVGVAGFFANQLKSRVELQEDVSKSLIGRTSTDACHLLFRDEAISDIRPEQRGPQAR